MDYQTQAWSDLWSYFFSLAPGIPLWLVYLAGIVLSLYHWRRNPKASALTLAAFIIFGLNALTGILFNFWIYFKARSLETGGIARAVAVGSIISSLLGTLAFALLLVAIFSQRSPRITDAETLKLP